MKESEIAREWWFLVVTSLGKPLGGTETTGQSAEPLLITCVLQIESLQRTRKSEANQDRWSPMTGPDNVDRVKIVLLYQEVEMRVHERESCASTPMA